MNRFYWQGSRINQQQLNFRMVGSDASFRTPALGFLLELSLLLLVASTVPAWVPRLMGLIWPETVESL